MREAGSLSAFSLPAPNGEEDRKRHGKNKEDSIQLSMPRGVYRPLRSSSWEQIAAPPINPFHRRIPSGRPVLRSPISDHRCSPLLRVRARTRPRALSSLLFYAIACALALASLRRRGARVAVSQRVQDLRSDLVTCFFRDDRDKKTRLSFCWELRREAYSSVGFVTDGSSWGILRCCVFFVFLSEWILSEFRLLLLL